MIKKIVQFITHDIWRIDVGSLPKVLSVLVNQLRIFLLAVRGYNEKDIVMRASGLTYYTLISIVPVIALAFGIAKGFGFEELLNEQISHYFAHQPEVSATLIDFSHSFLETTKGGVIAGVGIVMLLWSVIQVLTNVELSFNNIWGIAKPRTLVRKFTEYLSIMLIAPVFIILSGGITAFISSAATNIISQNHFFYTIGSVVQLLIKCIPYMLIWFLFTFIYVAIPNTKVYFKHALLAGIIAGTAFQLLEWVYFSFQIGVAQYNAVYGSFAALPLFLVWLQSSWLIVLFGCEIAFAGQNVQQYIYENEVNTISHHHKTKITFFILLMINKNFNAGQSAYTVNTLCEKLKLPVRLVQNVMTELLDVGLVMEAYTDKFKLVGYTPAKELNQMNVAELIILLEKKGNDDIPVISNDEWILASSTIEGFLEGIKRSEYNKKLGDM